MRIILLWLIFVALWINSSLCAGHLTDSSGQEILLKNALGNINKSPLRKDFVNNIVELCERGQEKGWYNAYDEFFDRLDPNGLVGASQTLSVNHTMVVSKEYTMENIRSMYRELLLKSVSDGADHPEVPKSTVELQEISDAFETIHRFYEKKSTTEARTQNE